MALSTIDQPAPFTSSLPSENGKKIYSDHLINDPLLARTLEALLAITDAQERMQARHLREKASLTLCEAIQLLRYLHHQGILEEEVDGRRVVNRSLAREYLSIIAPSEVTQVAPEETSFSQAQIAWACIHAKENKLTSMRIARPSKRTLVLARALRLTSSDTTGELIMPQSRALRLCIAVEEMGETERARQVDWAEQQLQQMLSTRAQP